MLHEKEESLFCSECGDEFSTIVCTLFLSLIQRKHQNFVSILSLFYNKWVYLITFQSLDGFSLNSVQCSHILYMGSFPEDHA
jgi:hypothetical protein